MSDYEFENSPAKNGNQAQLSWMARAQSFAQQIREFEWRTFLGLISVFAIAYFLPVGSARFDAAVQESLRLVKWYAQEHVLLCLIPAFFIAGAISVFVSQASVMRYLGPNANKWLAYGVASVAGTILAVCSCTVLPLFGGIYKMGAGLGPAVAFLYSGPAINVLAIAMTARVLGIEMGVARAIGAIVFSIAAGLAMHFLFRKEEQHKARLAAALPVCEVRRPLWQNVVFLGAQVGVLVFANWGRPDVTSGLWYAVYERKWLLASLSAVTLGVALWQWFGVSFRALVASAVAIACASAISPNKTEFPFVVGVVCLSLVIAFGTKELREWAGATWTFAKLIFPLLFAGVFVAGLLLGRPGHEGLIPNAWVENLVGGNSLRANLFAGVSGALMYFATLTEVPIIQGLLGSGMGKGPALALLLAGPALSLPSMLVLRALMGTKKMLAYVGIVVILATITGLLYGNLA
ncbi:MAG: permease [Candidatus Sumerlaeaceae bacterium]|nr:permease [Candidatus Sumerlaeaceae bacterium]